MAKKQFKKVLELTDEELFEDTESILEKEQIERVLKSKKVERLFTEPMYDSEKDNFINHRDWLVFKYNLDSNLNIAVDTFTLKVKNINYSDIINNRTETIPVYLSRLFDSSYSNILHYDAVMLGNNTQFKSFLLSL